MAQARRLILENKLGEGIRSFHVENAGEMALIYRHDNRRVELHADLSFFDENAIEYTVLKTLSVASLEKKSLALEGLGRLRLADSNEKLSSVRHELAPDRDDAAMTGFLKKASIGHAAAVALLIGGTMLLGYLTQKKEEPQLVTIQIPKKQIVVPKTVQHVKVSEKKIVQRKIPAHVKVADHTNLKPKPVQHKVAKTAPVVNKHNFAVKNVPKQANVDRVGALAVLGGLKHGARNAEGLDMNSIKNIRSAGVGQGGGGVGDAGHGGIRGMMPGSGLIAGSEGSGGKAQSAGGYGTKGSGGGKAGYGKISIVGGTSGINLPLDEEPTIMGGLDRDQIMAVINKNQGQIAYCYEQGLQRQSDLRGRVSVQFVINGAGRISTANISQSSLGSKSVEGCMIAKMKTWQFPKPVGHVNVDVLYPFDLHRVSSR